MKYPRPRPWTLGVGLWTLVFSATSCSTFRHPRDEWFAADKAKHAAVGFVAGAAGTAAAGEGGEPVLVGVSVAFALGAGKEVHDREIKGTYFSGKDLTWTVLGGLLGASAADAAH